MKYIVADKDLIIEQFTDDPCAYVWQFEPIDVVDGKTLVWDEEGRLYKIGTSQKFSTTANSKLVGVVNVGRWIKGKLEPTLVKLKDDDTTRLRESLIKYLSLAVDKRKGFPRLFFRSRSQNDKNFEGMSSRELIIAASERNR